MADQAGSAEAVVRDFFATLSTGDLERVAEFFDDESVWAVNNVDRGHPEVHGRSKIIDDLLRPVRGGLFEPGDPKVEVLRVVADGEWAVAETIGRGTMRNGTHYENSYVFVLRIVGRTVKYLKEYMDTAYAARVSAAVRAAASSQ